MAKQQTLFQAFGKSKSSGSKEAIPVNRPRDEKYGFDEFDFLGDEVTDEELVKACALAEENDFREVPPVEFHVGPSASEHSILNCSVIEEKVPGFDTEAGEIWVYPTNYPVRDYQFSIVHKSLFVNTLVCLPTGLGKTFIAAVVMYNFYRWFPHSKVVFLAPTKPLVAQQMEACFSIMGIPQEHTAEMTGAMLPRDRALMWQKKRVFFLTPQVMQNDLSRETCPVRDVTCVVFDEAHKALGNHAYCQVVKGLSSADSHYRVLALSATPGNDLKAVQQVVTNLQITHIELRSEESLDLQPYIHERKLKKIVVPLEGELLDIKNRFEKVLGSVLGRLCSYGVLYHAIPEKMGKYQLLQARDKFRASGPPEGIKAGAVEGDFALAISLFHGYELLQLHGLRSFHQFLKTTFHSGSNKSMAKRDIVRSPLFNNIMKQLAEDLSGTSCSGSMDIKRRFPVASVGESSSSEDVGLDGERHFYSHPKLQKLEEVVLAHFHAFEDSSSSREVPASTRVMIFSQYRESVQEISDLLSRHAPLVKAMTFVGHSSGKSTSKGLTQKEQTEIVRKFREGGYNTLVATCVGEEGLDIGEVDLIVCFDAAKSPIQLVQRMGRTGRKRSGRIIVLVSAGKEENMYSKSQSTKKSVHQAISEGCGKLKFYQSCPRMVPRRIQPKVHKMHMTVGEFICSKSSKRMTKGKGKESASKGKLGVSNRPGGSGKKKTFLDQHQLSCWSKELALSDRDFRAIEKSVGRCMPSLGALSSKGIGCSVGPLESANLSISEVSFAASQATVKANQKLSMNLGKWTHLQTAPVQTKIIEHSSKSCMLMSLLEFADLLHLDEGMGDSYDLEMKAFLNAADIKSGLDGRHEKGPTTGKKKQRVLEDMSDDEDFIESSDKIGRRNRTLKECLDKNGGCSTSDSNLSTGADHWQECRNMEDKDVVEEDAVEGEDAVVKEGEAVELDELHLAASQHIVPKPPSIDSLDWLDDIEPTQAQRTASQKQKIPRSRVYGRTEGKRQNMEDEELVEENFDFVTPKARPCQRASRLFASVDYNKEVSNVTTSTPRRHIFGSPHNENPEDQNITHSVSMDLFDGLSSKDIFDDFSVSGLRTVPINISNSHGPAESAGEQKNTSNSHGPAESAGEQKNSSLVPAAGVELGGFDNMDNIDISVIAESDFERDWDEEAGETDAGINLLPSSPSVECRSTGGNFSSEQDSSFQLNVAKRKRKKGVINAFLESPSSDSEVKKSRTYAYKSPVASDQDMQPGESKEFPLRLDTSADDDDDDDDDDNFIRVVRQKPTARQKLIQSEAKRSIPETDFVEKEAECEEPEGSDEESFSQEEDVYDAEDSFINDNSMLTQYEHCKDGKQKHKKVGSYGKQPALFSPLESRRDDIFTRRKYHAGKSRFRMVFSQRYKLLHHYMAKADGGSTCERLKTEEGKQRDECGSLSGSEAEEVHLLEEEEDEWEELSKSILIEDELSSEEVISNCRKEGRRNVCIARDRKRARFFSDSEDEVGELCRMKMKDLATRKEENVEQKNVEQEIVETVEQEIVEQDTVEQEIVETVEQGTVDSSEELFEEETNGPDKKSIIKYFDASQYRDVLISPSLLKVKRKSAVHLFSPEFDEWFEVDDSDEDESPS